MLKPIVRWWQDNALIIAITISIVIVITSLINPQGIPLKSIHVSDKTLHSFAYFVLMNAWMMELLRRNKVKFQYILLILLTIFGIIIEIFQGGMHNHRTQDLFDAIANFIGLLIGMIVFRYLFVKKIFFFN